MTRSTQRQYMKGRVMFVTLVAALGWALVLLIVAFAVFVLTYSVMMAARMLSSWRTDVYIEKLRAHQLAHMHNTPDRPPNVLSFPFGRGAA